MINLRSQVFATKEQEEQNTKKKKNKLCVLKTFRECLKKKNNCNKIIDRISSQILNSHGAIIKTWFLLWPWSLITQSFYSKYRQLSETSTTFRYRYFKQQKFAVCPLWIGFKCRFLGQSYSVVQVSSGKGGSENRKLGMVNNKKDKTCNSEIGWKKFFFQFVSYSKSKKQFC